MPSQRQVRWAQLRVGLVVIFASITLAVLVFLMTGPTGLFSRKIILKAFFDNAAGLRVGAPVRLEGVDIGNITAITVNPSHGLTPVEVDMKVSTRFDKALRKDSVATLSTAGVLGETFVDIDSRGATGALARNGDTLPTKSAQQLQDVVRASQGTLENVDILVRRMDRILTQIESGNGSIGKLIYDETLYNRLNSSVTEVQRLINQIGSGKGSVGKLIASDELYNKLNASIDNLNKIVDQINQGQGSIGKFLKDPSLFNNANATIAKANELMGNINAGKGALGKLASDPEFARKLDATVTNLSSISAKINDPHGTVGLLLTDPKVYNNADQALLEMRNLLNAVRQNPKKYLTIHMRIF